MRDREGLYLAEGLRFLCTAVDSRAPIVGLIVCRRLLRGPLGHTLIRRSHAPVVEVPESEFLQLSLSGEPQGVILVLRQSWKPLPSGVASRDLWVGVESVRTAGNLGTLMRSASAVGATGLMVFGPVRERADPFDPGCIRASMGASFRLKIVETSHREFRSWRHRYELRVLGADGGAPSDHRTVKMNRPLLIMLGSERDGLSEAQRITCDGFVRIPMSAGVDSLNVAMAGTVLLYEAWGQRHPVRRKT